jgi:branched-chain amino acid transport system permease protein
MTGGIPGTRFSRAGGSIALAGVAILATAPWWADASWLRLITEFACLLILAQMWNLMAGYGGLISVGQQAYLGVGGYLLFALADRVGISPFVAVPFAALGAMLLAAPLGHLVFRLQGGYFAIGTWVVAETCRLFVSNIAAVGGGSGQSLAALRGVPRAMRESTTYWIALGAAIASTLGVYWLMRHRFGLALTAIRDNEDAAASQGVNVIATKFAVYLIAAFGCGLAGALYFLNTLRISPDAAFTVNWTAQIVFIVVVGGIGTLEGPIIGALLFFLLRETLADYGTWYLILLGAIAIVVMLTAPQGVWGAVARRFDLHLFPVRRKRIDA